MSDEGTPTTATSESDQGGAGAPASGSGGDGAAGGAQAAEKFAAEREQLLAEARKHQSEADKAKAELARVKAAVAAEDAGDGSGGGSGTDAPALTIEQIRAEMRAEARREREMLAAVESLKSEYDNADPGIFTRIDEFDSVDALTAAVKSSHDSISTVVEARAKAREEEIRAAYAARYGDLPPADLPNGDQSGDPTVEQLNRMSVDELDELEKRDPGVIDRVLRSATK